MASVDSSDIATDIAVPAPNEPEINDVADAEPNTTPELVANDDHFPSEFDRQLAPDNTVQVGREKYSFDYDTNFPAFNSPELSGHVYPCLEAEYNNPNDYLITMANGVELEANETQKMLSEYSQHFSCLNVTMDQPTLLTGKIEYQGWLAKSIRSNQKLKIRILKKSERGNYVLTDAICTATLSGYCPNKSATSFVNVISFRLNKVQRLMPINIGEFDCGSNDDSDDEEDEISVKCLQKFLDHIKITPQFKADIVWKCDDVSFRRMSTCLASMKLLCMKDSNSASWRLNPGSTHSQTHMPLAAKDPKGPQLSEPIRDISIHGKTRNKEICYLNRIGDGEELQQMLAKLNASQKQAVKLSENNFLSVIQGPPGTGKTSTATAIIRRAFAAGQKILITAPSNTAVDNIIHSLLNSVPSNTDEHREIRYNITRLCSRGKYYKPDQNIGQYDSQAVALEPENFYDGQVSAVNRRCLIELKYIRRQNQLPQSGQNQLPQSAKLNKQEDRKADHSFHILQREVIRHKMRLVFTTCNGAADARLRGTFFDLVIINEAAQDVEPSTLIPLMRLHISGRACLLGDHCQLGPCLMSNEAESLNFSLTLFERLLNMNVPFVMLNEQYRMHSGIGSIVSELMYKGALKNAINDDLRTLHQLPHGHPTKMTGKPFLWVHVPTPENNTELNKSVENVTESLAVVDLAARCIMKDHIPGGDIVIISSYSAQVNRIRAAVDLALEYYKKHPEIIQELPKVRIGTVDGFQGQESNVVIYSVVRSNPYFSVGFLENAKRLNVVISCARCLLYIVGNATMFPAIQRGNKRAKSTREKSATSQAPSTSSRTEESGSSLVTRDQVSCDGLQNWRTLLDKCMKAECVYIRHEDCWNLQPYRLPHEKNWPSLFTGVPSKSDVSKIIATTNMTLTICVRDHLLKEFKITCIAGLRAQGCSVYCSPKSSNCNGWTDVTTGRLPKSDHEKSATSIRETLERFENFRRETKECFANPTQENRGVHCREWKLKLLTGPYAVPPHMEQLHYRDPEYGISHGIIKKGEHHVLCHLHIRHDIWRILVGELQKEGIQLYKKLNDQKIHLITEDGTLADTHEYMCGRLVTSDEWKPTKNWSLERAYDDFVGDLRNVLMNWKTWMRNRVARREADRRISWPVKMA